MVPTISMSLIHIMLMNMRPGSRSPQNQRRVVSNMTASYILRISSFVIGVVGRFTVRIYLYQVCGFHRN